MDTVEVKLLKYAFRFRKMTWREEFDIKYPENESRMRCYLASALHEISGLKIASLEDAKRVLAPIPTSVIQRVYIIYRGALETPQLFSTVGLYKAPEPKHMRLQFMEVEKETDRVMDRVEREMEQKFGRKELEEAKEVERQMAKNSKLRGATKSTPETPDA
jgi:tRNA-dihydrouridine synthase